MDAMTTEKTSLLPPQFKRDENGNLLPSHKQPNWGMFGYRGSMCDLAIKADNAPMLEECLDRDFFDPDAEMLLFKTVRQFCKETAPRCFAMLERRAPR